MTIIFRKSDFEQIQFFLVFENLTSSTQCIDYSKIKINEVSDKEAKISVPTNSCTTGHSLMLIFYNTVEQIPKRIPKNGQGKGILMAITGKITGKTQWDTNKELADIEFEFKQFEKDIWTDLIKKLKDKQVDINNTIEKISKL